MKLAGKTVLVTGSSKGIGAAIAEAMAIEGANVVVNYSSDHKSSEAVEKSISKYNVQSLIIKADITSQDEVDEMMQKIEAKFSKLDVLVNNAGTFYHEDGPDSIEAFEAIFKTNFLGQIRVTNAARKLMDSGKIIFISSIHGKLGHGRPDVIAYSSLKAALDSYMKNLAKELAPDILVNAVAPGRTLTPMWGDMDETYKVEQASGHLINRWIKPSEIADGVVFLAKSDAITGEILTIDGGMSLKVLG